MKTRIMVSAFLRFNDKILLIHRSNHKKIAPGMWSGIGGHMEPDELNHPLKTCYREIEEETGITKEMMSNLKLKYITTRIIEEEIRTGYYFVGDMKTDYDLPSCNEGSLHWVNLSNIAEKPMTFSVKQITNHWISNLNDDNTYLCGINRDNNKITWTKL